MIGKHPTYVEESYRTFQEEVAGALDGLENVLVECGAADNSIKLNTAVANASGVFVEKLQPGTGRKDDCKVRMLGKEGTVKVIQNAAIGYGKRVMVDSSAMTKVKEVPATAGRFRSIGIKISQGGGAQNDVMEMLDLPEIVEVVSTDTLSALTFTTGAATGPEVAALRDALKTLLEAQGLMA